MFNSKDIQKELERNYNIVLSDSSIIKNIGEYGIFIFKSNLMT